MPDNDKPRFNLELRRRKKRQGDDFQLDSPEDEFNATCENCGNRMTVYKSGGDLLGKGNAKVVPSHSAQSKTQVDLQFFCSTGCLEEERPPALKKIEDND